MQNAIANWSWSKLSSAKWEDVWEERLAMLPPGSWMMVHVPGSRSVRLQAFGTKASVERLRKQFGGSVRMASQALRTKGLEQLSKPLRVRDRLVVVQTRVDAARLRRELPGRKILHIPPGLAFGTGLHPTTAGCLRLLVDHVKAFSHKPWSLVDLGAGSGILALAGRALGAEIVCAYDYDATAVKTALANSRLNHLKLDELRELDVLNWKPRRRFDILTANLFSEILQAAVPRFADALSESGAFIFSGILRHQWAECRRSFERAGLNVNFLNPRGKWVYGIAYRNGK